MVKITREHVTYALSALDEPAAVVEPGECVEFETYDCYQGKLLKEGSTFADVDRRFGNPATGPVYIKGAQPGDLLKIEIKKLELGPVGILDIGPTSGALREFFEEPVIRRLPVKDGYLLYNDSIRVPIKPMIGVIGTAPLGEPVSTKAPKDHGGNMDCTRIEEGAVLYLPVFVEGGLLSTGDFHAIMGEGEVANCGVEIEGKATLKIDVVKNTGITYPVLENREQWMTIAYGEDLDEASEKAVKQMFAFLCGQKKLSKVDAGMLIDMAGDLIVCQIVNPYKTVRLEVPKWLIARIKEENESK
ncbi:MAG: acetamidase/formamidase family protein [Eubacteriales bacterium]|nr:acetamidase/formamidase family protein [Eubacteriales bacterium]